MAKISDLPREITILILRQLDHVRALSPARLACRQFESAFQSGRARILRDIAKKQIGHALLPYAMSVVMDKPALGSPALTDMVREVFDESEDVRIEIERLSIDQLYAVFRTHATISEFVSEFSERAWVSALASFQDRQSIPPASLSPEEDARFLRAFYRVELFFSLFGRVSNGETPMSNGPVWFYGQHNPWECHQILGVYEFLDDMVRQVSNNLAESAIMSTEGAALFHQFSMANGLRHIRRIRDKFPSVASDEAMAAAFESIIEEPWLDPFAPRHNCDLSGYSDHNDSLMVGLPRSSPEYSHRDGEMGRNWAGAYRHRQGIPDEDEMRFLRRAGLVFWDEDFKGRILSPISFIYTRLASQAEEASVSGSEYVDSSEDGG